MLIMTFKYGGRLANRLLAFSHLIAFSETYNVKVRYPGFDEYAQYFKGTANNFHCAYPKKGTFNVPAKVRLMVYVANKAIIKTLDLLRLRRSALHQVVEADIPEYAFDDNRYFDMNDQSFVDTVRNKGLVLLVGRFFRGYSNIDSHQDVIRQFFEPIDSIQARIDKYFKETAGDDADVVVGVHRRGGDYREFAQGKYYFSERHYHEKLKDIQKLFPGKKVLFIICSNEPVNLDVYGEVSAVKGPGDVVEDLYVLAKCDYIVGAPSTYSLWSSFYGKKPLCHLWGADTQMTLDNFKILPKEVLYNYSFN